MRAEGRGSDLRREARARERAPVWPRPSGRVPARPVPPAELGPRQRGRTVTAPGPAQPASPSCTSPAHLPGARTPAPPSPGASGLQGGRWPTGNSEAHLRLGIFNAPRPTTGENSPHPLLSGTFSSLSNYDDFQNSLFRRSLPTTHPPRARQTLTFRYLHGLAWKRTKKSVLRDNSVLLPHKSTRCGVTRRVADF